MKNFLTMKTIGIIVGFALLISLPFLVIKEETKIVKDDTINPFEEPKDEAAAYIHKASDNYFFREFDKGAENYRKAIAIYEKRKDFAKVAKTYESLGDLYVWANNVGDAETSYLEAVKHHAGTKNALGEANALKEVADLRMKVNDFSQAEGWYKKSLAALKDEKSNRVQGSVYEGMGHMYWKEEKIPEAMEAFNHAKETYAALNYTMGVEHMGNILYRLKNGTKKSHRHALRDGAGNAPATPHQ